MKPSATRPSSNAKWFWIVVLLALFVVTIAWFANPLGTIEGSPRPVPTAEPTEWTTAPNAPVVEVTLPQTPVKNRTGDDRDGSK